MRMVRRRVLRRGVPVRNKYIPQFTNIWFDKLGSEQYMEEDHRIHVCRITTIFLVGCFCRRTFLIILGPRSWIGQNLIRYIDLMEFGLCFFRCESFRILVRMVLSDGINIKIEKALVEILSYAKL